MRIIVAVIVGFVVLGVPCVVFAQSVAQESKTYALMQGDTLSISVWKEEALQREVIIRPDGKFSFPLVGHIQAAGETPEEVEQVIRQKLSSFIPDPLVTVSVRKVTGNEVYVIGKVTKPGQYTVPHDIDVMQALSLAGGLSTFANQSKIKILRREQPGQVVFKFDYDEVSDGIRLEQNILLKTGDVIVVR